MQDAIVKEEVMFPDKEGNQAHSAKIEQEYYAFVPDFIDDTMCAMDDLEFRMYTQEINDIAAANEMFDRLVDDRIFIMAKLAYDEGFEEMCTLQEKWLWASK